jgi:hypothetical protein
MPGQFTAAFDTMYATMTDAHAQVRIGTHIIEQALTTGRMQTSTETDLGSTRETEMNIRVKEPDEDQRFPLTIGKAIEVNHAGRGWERVRIMGRKNTAGIIMLEVETPYE